MKRFWCTAGRFICFATLCAGVLSSPARTEPIAAKLKTFLDSRVETDQFSGSVGVYHDDRPLLAAGFGFANVELGVPNTPQTKFRIGSITKQFTAACILLLAEQGKVDVEDRVNKYLADAPSAWSEITIHQLLTHTAGLFNITALPDHRRNQAMPSTPLETIAKIRDRPLDFRPGARFKYSNTGYIVLGVVVERASGRTYEAFLNEYLFQPLEMTSTGYDHAAPIVAHRAAGYVRAQNGELLNASYVDMSSPYAAGAIYSTIEDLARWDQALRSGRVLSTASREKMFTPGIGNYGYGWMIAARHGRKEISHGGAINGFNAFLLRVPDEKLCVAVLSNIMESRPGKPAEIARDLADIVLDGS